MLEDNVWLEPFPMTLIGIFILGANPSLPTLTINIKIWSQIYIGQ